MINSVYPLTMACPPAADDRAGSWPGAGVARAFARAVGAGPLSHDEAHGRRVADLTVYLRQHHAERDLAELGALVADSSTAW